MMIKAKSWQHWGKGAFLLLILSACMRPEKPWPRPTGTDMTTLVADLGSEYDTVAFLSLSQGLFHKVPRTAWDLEIHSTGSGYQVWTNAALYAFAGVLDSATWAGTTDPSSIPSWQCDLPDKAALPPLSYDESLTFVLDRDKGSIFYSNPAQRYQKIQLKATAQGITVRTYTMSGTPSGEWTLPRSPQPQYLSLDKPGHTIAILPPWEVELILTRYVHYYPDQPEQFRYYPVVGALLPIGRRAAVVSASEISFEDFTYASLSQLQWTTQRDAIGYDWKRYSFETGTYVIDFSRYYVLEMGPEAYYKVQFVDFYDEAGRKGSVKLRYSGL